MAGNGLQTCLERQVGEAGLLGAAGQEGRSSAMVESVIMMKGVGWGP